MIDKDDNVALVAIGRPIPEPYSYRIPEEALGVLCVGDRVSVDLRGKEMVGVVVGFTNEESISFELKDIKAPLDIYPIVDESSYKLARWITNYYRSFIGETINAMIPGGVDVKTYDIISLNKKALHNISEWNTSEKLTGELMRYIAERGYITYSDIRQDFGIWRGRKEILRLIDEEYLTIHPFITNPASFWEKGVFCLNDFEDNETLVDKLKRSTAKRRVVDEMVKAREHLSGVAIEDIVSRSVIKDMITLRFLTFILNDEKRIELQIKDMPEPTDEQDKVLGGLKKKGFVGFNSSLIFGVTGSGKTYIYMNVCAEVLKEGKNAIILVPEISITPQTIERFRDVFGDTVEVIHSSQTPSSRFNVWRKCRLGLICCVVGPRSAVMTPISNLGLIVVDEEHDGSYKQSDREPRYNARDVAVMRGQMEDFPVILGSATPSVETFYNSKRGKYELYTLKERVLGFPLPRVEVLNLNKEEKYRGSSYFTMKLIEGVFEVLSEGRQVILLQNRRGFATVLVCKKCGAVYRCSNCDVTLTYHKVTHSLLCHYCGKSKKVPDVCGECKSDKIEFYGLGTERVLEELEDILSDYSLIRMDSDTTRKTGSHTEILKGFETGEYQVLIGTQMVSQGLDFPDVGLVGVLSADTSLCFPDFMAGERTFQLLTHIAGRSGRSEMGGRAIIQTLHPTHYAIRFAEKGDYLSFYDYEIKYRRALGYPPVTKLASILVEDRRKNVAREQSENFRDLLLRIVKSLSIQDKAVIRGPAPAPISRLKGFYRWQLLITTLDTKTRDMILDGMKGVKLGPQGKWGKIVLDVDPVDLL